MRRLSGDIGNYFGARPDICDLPNTTNCIPNSLANEKNERCFTSTENSESLSLSMRTKRSLQRRGMIPDCSPSPCNSTITTWSSSEPSHSNFLECLSLFQASISFIFSTELSHLAHHGIALASSSLTISENANIVTWKTKMFATAHKRAQRGVHVPSKACCSISSPRSL